MNDTSGRCIGCGRTLDEIARWGAMSHRERQEIMRELSSRLARVAAPKTREEMT